MPHCKVCLHPARPRIDDYLAVGISYRKLAAVFGLSRAGLGRHHNRHNQEGRSASAAELIRTYFAAEANPTNLPAVVAPEPTPECQPEPITEAVTEAVVEAVVTGPDQATPEPEPVFVSVIVGGGRSLTASQSASGTDFLSEFRARAERRLQRSRLLRTRRRS